MPPNPPPIPGPRSQQTDATGGVIPYKNAPALTAYYLGIFSLIPGLGFLLGIGSVVLGIIGFRKYRATPVIRGQIHAWVGIILGTLVVAGHIILLLALIGSK